MVEGGRRNDLPLTQAAATFPSYARLPVAFPRPSRQSLPPRDCLEGRGVARCGRSGGSSRTKRWLIADGAAAHRGRSSGSLRTERRLIADEAAARRPRATTAHESTENHFSIHHPPSTLHDPPSSWRGLGGGSPSTIHHPPFTSSPSSWRGLGGGPFLHDPPSSWRGLGGGQNPIHYLYSIADGDAFNAIDVGGLL